MPQRSRSSSLRHADQLLQCRRRDSQAICSSPPVWRARRLCPASPSGGMGCPPASVEGGRGFCAQASAGRRRCAFATDERLTVEPRRTLSKSLRRGVTVRPERRAAFTLPDWTQETSLRDVHLVVGQRTLLRRRTRQRWRSDVLGSVEGRSRQGWPGVGRGLRWSRPVLSRPRLAARRAWAARRTWPRPPQRRFPGS